MRDEKEHKTTMQDTNKSGMAYVRAFKSALAAALGVQSKENLEQDFKQNSILPYIAAGLVLTVMFISILVLIARLAAY